MNEKAGAILVGAVEGLSLTAEERRFFASTQLAGVTLFKWNIPDPYPGVVQLNRDLQNTLASGAPPMIIAIDQEGGRVSRFKRELCPDFPNQGPALKLAGGGTDAPSIRCIAEYAFALARALKALGINVNFAPVADIDTEPTNTAIGDRCFGKDWESVVQRAGIFLSAMQEMGVLGCLKHFPGQGDAKVDTHHGPGVIDLKLAALKEREFVPFEGMLAHAPMVMISHCIYPALDTLPASLSKRVMQDLLRGKMGFKGVVVSDDMNMGAIAQDEKNWTQAIVDAVAAGADMILVCKHLEKMRRAHEALTVAAQKSAAFASRLEEAAARVFALRKRLSA